MVLIEQSIRNGLLVAAVVLNAALSTATLTPRNGMSCKVFPGDKDWPSASTWASFNKTVGGALIKTVPHAAVCHSSWPEYDAAKCTELYNSWGTWDVRVSDPTDIQSPYYQGFSCMPSLNASTPCTIGGSPQYSVNVSSSDQIAATLSFAKKHNIRLIIKNTGHDFSGKSTGAGSLSIWTHNMKNIDFIAKYSDSYYTGPALKVGAGVSLGEYYLAAKNNGVTVVGGECSTVGVAGGYFSGAGHSPIAGLYGMAADNVVAIEAVLPDGSEVSITSSKNPDLFWAFRGGGGSTFGVVTSITVKAHPKTPTTIGWFNFTTSDTVSNDTFWNAVEKYFDYMPKIADSNSQGYVYIFPIPGDVPGVSFQMYAMTSPNMTVAQWHTLMDPLFAQFKSVGVDVTPTTGHYDNYYDAWTASYPPNVGGYSDFQTATGSRLIPRANWENKSLRDKTYAVFKDIGVTGHGLVVYAQNNPIPPGVSNAVNPAYRPSLMFLITSALFTSTSTVDEINAAFDDITNVVVPKLKAVSPGSGTYMNEADSREPDFQQSFYGSNYPRLLKIKQRVDPDGLLYAPTAVGSEYWVMVNNDGFPDTQTGRLCKKSS